MKKKYTLLILLLTATAANARTDDTPLRVTCKDGSSLATTTADVERIEIKDGMIIVVPKTGEATTFSIADIDRIAMGELASGVNEAMADGRKMSITVTPDAVKVGGAAHNATASVYNADGRLIATANCVSGNAEFSLTGNNPGVYIIKVGSFAAKFTKR